MNDKGWTVQKRLVSARRASQMAVFDNEIERWGEVDVPYLHLSSSEVIRLPISPRGSDLQAYTHGSNVFTASKYLFIAQLCPANLIT
ncbi:hypothetical protein J6590_066635 [Homalodisca vitripennis]|nr:hypothetical protein J6590_066635 [Homalodisca vitripennis]